MAVESWNARLFRNEMRAEWWPKITVCIVVYIPPPFLGPVTNSSRHHTSVLRDFHHPPIHDYVSAQTSTFLKNFQLFLKKKKKKKSNLIFIWPYSSPARFLFGFTRFDFPIVWVPQTVGFFFSFLSVCVLFFLGFRATSHPSRGTGDSVTWRVESDTSHTGTQHVGPTRRKIVTITVKYRTLSGFKRCSRHAVRHKYDDGAPTYGERRSIKHQLIWRAVVVILTLWAFFTIFFFYF